MAPAQGWHANSWSVPYFFFFSYNELGFWGLGLVVRLGLYFENITHTNASDRRKMTVSRPFLQYSKCRQNFDSTIRGHTVVIFGNRNLKIGTNILQTVFIICPNIQNDPWDRKIIEPRAGRLCLWFLAARVLELSANPNRKFAGPYHCRFSRQTLENWHAHTSTNIHYMSQRSARSLK